MRVRNYLSLPPSQREEAEDEVDSSGATGTSSSPAPPTGHDELLVDLRNFVAFQASVDGQATTQEVLEYFKPRLTQQQAPVFRELLRSICDFRRTCGQEGIWRLKEHFRWAKHRLSCDTYAVLVRYESRNFKPTISAACLIVVRRSPSKLMISNYYSLLWKNHIVCHITVRCTIDLADKLMIIS